MRYRYEINNEVASIKEMINDQYIAINMKIEDAKRLTKHLNLGGGFDGHTPSFFCEIIKKSSV